MVSIRRSHVLRVVRVLLVVAVAVSVGAPSASASSQHQLSRMVVSFWQTILQTPAAQNPLASGNPWCLMLPGRVLAPVGPYGTLSLTCTVKPGTRVLADVAAAECSTVEAPPFYGANEEQMRACAVAVNAGITVHALSVDGLATPVQEVQSRLIALDLPADNILGAPAGPAFSVADDWAATLHPMTPGTHVLITAVAGTDVFGNPVDFTQTFTVKVQPR